MSGKGSKRRPPSKPGAYEDRYSEINWGPRKPPAPTKPDVGRVLIEDYGTQVEWVIPSIDEILGQEERK